MIYRCFADSQKLSSKISTKYIFLCDRTHLIELCFRSNGLDCRLGPDVVLGLPHDEGPQQLGVDWPLRQRPQYARLQQRHHVGHHAGENPDENVAVGG